ncbi:TetR/AcrR family transcriptional regulator [Streptomyces sp. NBC_00989]|uniref:TetR/AcrR family transcriptional regulator n=1 Tax=Streptomyces sp. NBC_00989 TaxID=2903705 RepID=UPI00386A6D05|nr:TetR/AcrR family transcriptional regulator [Streptomyces sp. NBC_00989]
MVPVGAGGGLVAQAGAAVAIAPQDQVGDADGQTRAEEHATKTDDAAADTAGGAREGILQAAVELIARDGFDGVRIADIAARAGVSTALVHYHFTGRERLLTGALAHSLTRAEARLAGRTRQADRDTPPQRLADLIDFGLPLTHDDVLECRLWAELEIRSSGSPELAATLAEFRARMLHALAALVEDGLRTGDFRDCDPSDVATVALALLDGLTNRLITEESALGLADARRLAAGMLTLAVHYDGDLPFQPLPDPGTPPLDLAPQRATPRPACFRQVLKRRPCDGKRSWTGSPPGTRTATGTAPDVDRGHPRRPAGS